MSKLQKPELKKYMDKRLQIKLNGNRVVAGVLLGFDQFMNLTLGEAAEVSATGDRTDLGTVFIRGNSVEMMECLDPIQLGRGKGG